MGNLDASAPLLADQTAVCQHTGGCWGSTTAPFRRLWNRVYTSISWAASTVWLHLSKEPDKAIHGFKMALALTLAFLLVLLKAPYALFGSHAIWAIMTVIVVFEVTVGATLSKGLNRGAGTLLAGALAVVLSELSDLSEGIMHPVMVGASAFIVGGVVTFGRLWPTMKPYEYGFRTFLITFSYIMVAEYRQSDPVNTAVNRFFIILLGAVIGLSVNIFVLPLWAGEELHEFVSKNFGSLADSLEVCVHEYLRGAVLERVPSKILMGLAADDPVYKGYRLALLSAAKEESLATFAGWEPPHGRFRRFKYPWQNYVKVGAILRHCTYSVVALHACLRSAIQAPLQVRSLFKDELLGLSQQCALVFRKLGQEVLLMQKNDHMTILNGVHKAIEQLQHSLYLHSYLLVRPETGILEQNLMEELPLSVIPEIKQNEGEEDEAGAFVQSAGTTTVGVAFAHEASRDHARRRIKKLHSWPYRQVDDFEFAKDQVFEQKVRVLESASALSLGTFATLLVEVALRLDYLVEAVDELGTLAGFKDLAKEQTTGVEARRELNGRVYSTS
ncbi:hypothetical protein L7F22_048850 [Adiantum nelumboides]|nr:hypothetical protein [Adiantum nelumboides]